VSSDLSAKGASTGLTSIAFSPIDPKTAAVSAHRLQPAATGGHIFLTRGDSGAHWNDISTTGGFS